MWCTEYTEILLKHVAYRIFYASFLNVWRTTLVKMKYVAETGCG
jgi:hypothetical protein